MSSTLQSLRDLNGDNLPVAHLVDKKFVDMSQTGLVRKLPAGEPEKLARKLCTGAPARITRKSHTREPAKFTGGCETLVACISLARKPPTDLYTIEEALEPRSPLFM